MGTKPCKLSGTFFNCISIDRNYNNQQSILPHMHDNRLELFYVCSGQGHYMVDNRYYPIGEGDIVICNQGVLHGEEPDQVRQIRSYSVAITDVNVEGLPPNCLIAEGECPVVSCGQLARQVGETMHLLYLLSADAENLHAVCCSLAEAMLNLTDSLLRSRIHQQEQQREMPSVLAHRVRRYLDAHHCEPITLRMVAERLRVSEYYLAHVFKQEFGVPPMQYVMKRRIHSASAVSVTSTPCLRSTPAHRPASSGSHSSRASRTAKKEKVKKRNRKTENTVQSSNALHGVFSILLTNRRMAQPRERAAAPVKWRCV